MPDTPRRNSWLGWRDIFSGTGASGRDPFLLVIILFAGLLRLWLALADHSIYWPDEIYQSLEQAHRVAFGYGIIPWEFRDGARSWLLPGAIAGVWKLAAALGVQSSIVLVALARSCMVLASSATIWLSARVAGRLGGKRAAWVAAGVLAVIPVSVVFGFRTMSETVSAPLVVLSLSCLLDRSSKGAALAGVWLGLAALLRYQNVLFAFSFVPWLLVQQRGRDTLRFCAGAAACAVAGGLLDWATWGSPFHSLITYLKFNLLQDGASTFGVESVWYYATSLWNSTGPALLVLCGLALLGAVYQRALGLAAALYLVVHSLIPHKELRFLVPCLPFCSILVGVGAAQAHARWPQRPALWWAGLSSAVASMAVSLTTVTYGSMGQYLGTPRAERSVWHADEDANLLLAKAGQRADLCGIALLGLRAAFTGGYTYLHKQVPLLYGSQLCDSAPSANYVLLRSDQAEDLLPSTYSRVAERGDVALFRRDGVCEAPPAGYDSMLEGAHNMGLRLPVPEQRLDGSYRLDLLRHSGAFTQGWGNGEILDCQPGRWAQAKHASIKFRIDTNTTNYDLKLRLRAYNRSPAQHLTLQINGKALYDGQLAPTSTDLKLNLLKQDLLKGENVLDFDFGRTWRPGGDDTRELAALLQAFELVPMSDDFKIDVGTLAEGDHLALGFSANEVEDGLTFAWNEGPYSEVAGILVDPDLPHVLVTRAQSIPWAASKPTRVSVNGQPAGVLAFTSAWSTQALLIPSELLKQGLNRVRYSYEMTNVTPAALNPTSTDARQLAVRFESILLTPLPSVSGIDFGTPESHLALLEGWSVDELEEGRTATWSLGQHSNLALSLFGTEDATLEVDVRAFAPALPLNVSVVLNGTLVGTFSPSSEWQTYAVPLKSALFTPKGDIIEFRFDRTARPSQHDPTSKDDRELALRFDRLRIIRASVPRPPP
jgi:GPI mannosyltransferase 3